MSLLHCDATVPADAPSGPIWWLLHGFMGDARDWDGVVERLAQRDVGCLCVNLPGHGGTPWPVSADPFEAVADALAETLQAHAQRPRVLVGYSLGGRLALELLARRPGLVDGLVLESAAPGGLADAAERTARAALDDSRAEAIRADPGAFLQRWYAAPLFASLQRHPEARAAAIARRADQDPDALAEAVRAWSPGRQPARLDLLRRVSEQIPVMWIGGRLDVKYTRVGQAIASACPAIEVALVDDAGHNVHLEQPDAFVELLESLRARLT